VKAYGKNVWCKNVDEGAFVNILSSFACQDLGSPQLVPITHNLLAFNKTISEPLGILPKLPITLEGKIVYIDLMIVQGPLDFNFLFGQDYVYTMEVVVSIPFCVLHFPHNGNIVTIYQLSFIYLDSTTSHLTFLNVPYLKVVSTLPQVNYMATTPMSSVTDASEPLTILSTSYYLDLLIDIGNLMGEFEMDFLTPFDSLHMYSFQNGKS